MPKEMVRLDKNDFQFIFCSRPVGDSRAHDVIIHLRVLLESKKTGLINEQEQSFWTEPPTYIYSRFYSNIKLLFQMNLKVFQNVGPHHSFHNK